MVERLGIGEFARRAGLSVSALRFYADRGLLPPREINADTGYRFYDDDQLPDANLIRDLRQGGMSLAEIDTFLAADPAARRELLESHLAAISAREATARAAADRVLAHLPRSETPMTSVTVAAAELGAALDQVLPAAGADAERPVLTCVLLEAKDGSLRLVATDSYRLAIRDLVVTSGPQAAYRVLMPAATLRRWRPQVPDRGPADVGVLDKHLIVRVEDLELRHLPVPASFPAYEALLSRDNNSTAVVADRAAILAALEPFTDSGDAVLLQFGDGHLTVLRRDDSQRIDTDYHGPELNVAVNPIFAAAAIHAATGPDIVIEVTDPVRPLVFRSADDGTFTTMLMPIRLT